MPTSHSTANVSNGKYKVFALLGLSAALSGSYRRFGTGQPSNPTIKELAVFKGNVGKTAIQRCITTQKTPFTTRPKPDITHSYKNITWFVQMPLSEK
jgi:hypothetical protein